MAEKSGLKIATIFGTRPEIIRLSRVFDKLDRYVDHVMIHTGQSYDYAMNEVFFKELRIRKPDYFLEVKADTLGGQLAKLFEKTEEVLNKEKPDAVVVLGDTNSALSVILAKRMHVPIFHLEAGNRSFDERVPEEINRRIIDHISDVNLAYSENARQALLREGLHPSTIFVTGSPIAEIVDFYKDQIEGSGIMKEMSLLPREYLLASIHREENVDSKESLMKLLDSLEAIHQHYQKPIVMTVHPRTAKKFKEYSLKPAEGIVMHDPFGYFEYVKLQKNALCVLSDSGTIIEEAAVLNFPAVQVRNSSERPEGYDCGVSILSGLEKEVVLRAVAVVTDQFSRGETFDVPDSYISKNFSTKVMRHVIGLTNLIQEKKKSGFMP
jgi:UDP-N-acetylglucosamine 2-epimerase (non-hydrolysing)